MKSPARGLLCGLCALLMQPAVAEQVCREAADWRPERVLVRQPDGSVIDARAGLQWQGCAWGQQGPDCAGAPERLSAMQADDLVHVINRQRPGGHADWRMPTQDELALLLSPNCLRPAISLAQFPNAPGIPFWAHYDADSLAPARHVDFESGLRGEDDYNLPNGVRLVRDLPKPRR